MSLFVNNRLIVSKQYHRAFWLSKYCIASILFRVCRLLELDEFFNGNTEEDSIAPNQWEFGRPTLSEIWDMLQKIELMPNIAWVRVALHDDTEIVENNGAEELVLAGDSIVICTTILPTELEKLVNCEWLCSDGVITIKASELNIYSCVPPIPENFNCLEIVWD